MVLERLQFLLKDPEVRKLTLGGALALILLVVTLFLLWGNRGKSIEIPLESTLAAAKEEIVVDVSGAVLRPGVYRLPNDSIVDDAIIIAGGFSVEVDLERVAQEINRAQLLEDHGKLYLPKKGDQLAYAPAVSGLSTNQLTGSPAGTVNINTASLSDLDSLPGIGPVTAQKIVDFRKMNGPFKNKEDLKLVPGIGESKYEKIKGLISL